MSTWDQFFTFLDPLMGTGHDTATSNNMKLVHWPYGVDG